MCTVLLPPGDNPIAVNTYIKSFLVKGTFHRLVDVRLYTIAVSLLLILVMLRCPVILNCEKD